MYETLIDFGAHPNQLSVMALVKAEETDRSPYDVGILNVTRSLSVRFALRGCGDGNGALKTFQLVFPERYHCCPTRRAKLIPLTGR